MRLPPRHEPPAIRAGGNMLVEAAGQSVRSFRNGLDYAITPAKPGAGRVIPDIGSGILVSAHCKSQPANL
jgi:hypothetical protein